MKRFAPSRCASFSQDRAGILIGLRASDALKHTSTRAGRNSRQDRLLLSSRSCPHEPIPFIEAAAKAKVAGGIETQRGWHRNLPSLLGLYMSWRVVRIALDAKPQTFPEISVNEKDPQC